MDCQWRLSEWLIHDTECVIASSKWHGCETNVYINPIKQSTGTNVALLLKLLRPNYSYSGKVCPFSPFLNNTAKAVKTSEQIWQSHETLMATCCKICLPCLHVITSWGLICPKITFLGGISAPSHELMIRAVIKIFYHLVSSLLFFGVFF